eukprot:GHRR01020516.1.p2 GENE.GHRR01020516.1~~GHRR01020516.1.p2  ORF type:complete len:109 (+),score=30.82 GHRR01020516.1:322-648(+)
MRMTTPAIAGGALQMPCCEHEATLFRNSSSWLDTEQFWLLDWLLVLKGNAEYPVHGELCMGCSCRCQVTRKAVLGWWVTVATALLWFSCRVPMTAIPSAAATGRICCL